MKTTLNLNDALLSAAKAFAAQQHTTLTRLIEDGLALRLRVSGGLDERRKKSKFDLPVFQGEGGLVAGVNPLSNQSVLDAAD